MANKKGYSKVSILNNIMPVGRGLQKSYKEVYDEKLAKTRSLVEQKYKISTISMSKNKTVINFKGSFDNETVGFSRIERSGEKSNIAMAAEVLTEAGYFNEEIARIKKLKKTHEFTGYILGEDEFFLNFKNGDDTAVIKIANNSKSADKTKSNEFNKEIIANVMIKSGYLTQEQAVEIFPIESNGRGGRGS